MVNITFKNVGQGDSIIIEWKEGDKSKIGIIDCNQVSTSLNPVLEHIIEVQTKEIEFLLLSHPHKDHYSGFFNLIKYCREHNIFIKSFLHTSTVSIEYRIAASRSISETKELVKLYEMLFDMRDSGELNIYNIDDNPDTIKKLSGGFNLEFLAPSSVEVNNYINGIDFPFDEENSTSNPNGNWLCSIVRIFNENTSVILSSDVESQVLNRLNIKNGRLKSHKSILVQIPHHGSKRNLNKSFWTGLSKYPKVYSVISVGKNSYNHPSKEVVEFFSKHPNYILERTDLTNPISQKAKANSGMLNVFSKQVNQNPSVDLSYQLSGDTCVKI